MAGFEGGYYEHSGQFSPAGLAKSLFVGMGVGALCAAIVAYCQVYIPFIYVNFLFSVGFGALVGIVTANLLTGSHTRNTPVGLLVVFLAVACSLYLCWAIWLDARLARADVDERPGLVALILDPGKLWAWVELLNAVGVWKVKGSTPTGNALWAIWGTEAAVVFGFAFWSAFGELTEHPFCETCRAWCKHFADVVRLKPAEKEELRVRLEAGDMAFLEGLGVAPEGAVDFVGVDLHSCEKCGDMHALTAKIAALRPNKEGKLERTDTAVATKLLVDREQAARVRKIAEKAEKAAAAAKPPVEAKPQDASPAPKEG